MIDIKTDFPELIKNKDWKLLKYSLNELDSFQVAQLLEDLSDGDDTVLFRMLDRKQAKDVFPLLPYSKQEDIIEGIAQNAPATSNLLNDIEPDDRTAFFGELPGKITQRLIQLLSPQERAITTKLLGYPEDSIGRLMTPEYVAIKSDFTVAQAFEHIRKFGVDSETLNVVYIIDRDWKLIDDIRIKELILASPEQSIHALMDNKFVALRAIDDQETAIKVFRDYDRVALPVVDDEGVLLGIITIDDIMDVEAEESTEDFHKFGAFQDAIESPLKAKPFYLYRKRIVWLFALVFVNVFSGAAISSFETVIQSMVSLVFFLPLLIDSGGNAGSQSATLMIRSLAIGDVKISDWYKLIGKEVIVSLLLGVTMAIGVASIASFRAPELVMVVGITMVLIVMVGSMTGMLLPFIFTKLKLDPATASAPLITSISDIFGVVIYFSVATWYLGM